MPSPNLNDFAQTVRIDALTPAHISKKLRIVGRMRLYNASKAIVCLADDQDTLLVDISLCLTGFLSFPWLREENTTIMTIGYLEASESSNPLDATPPMILRALFIKEQPALDVDVWNKALDARSRQREHE